MSISDALRIEHMRDSAREIVAIAASKRREDLDTDRLLTLALTKLVEIIGEAAYQTSSSARAQYPEFPWQDVTDMRHKLVHHYYALNRRILWLTISKDVPAILPLLEKMAADAKP